MDTIIAAARARKQVVLHRQISDDLRGMIANGTYLPGSRMPPIQELADLFQTSYYTMHSALTPLEKEGLIQRRRRTGTYVCSRHAILTCAGIYGGVKYLQSREPSFYRELCKALQHELSLARVKSEVWTDTRPEAEQDMVLPALQRAITRSEIQGLLVAEMAAIDLPWLKELSLPVSMMTEADVPNRVAFGQEEMLRTSLEHLRAVGCTSVGLICTRLRSETLSDGKAPIARDAEFRRLAQEYGLKTDKDWARFPAEPLQHHEQFGYEQFLDLWGMPQRPAGLIVWSDLAARGVVNAVLKLGVLSTDELKLVLHRNEGIGFFCPREVTWLESSLVAAAKAMVAQVRAGLTGERVRPVSLPFAIKSV